MAVTRVRYSEAFKRQVVGELEQGGHRSLHSACRAYGIGATTTVSNWVRRYGREDLLPKNVRVETMKERDELKEARSGSGIWRRRWPMRISTIAWRRRICTSRVIGWELILMTLKKRTL